MEKVRLFELFSNIVYCYFSLGKGHARKCSETKGISSCLKASSQQKTLVNSETCFNASQRDSFEKNVLRTLILQAMMIEKLIVDGRSATTEARISLIRRE